MPDRDSRDKRDNVVEFPTGDLGEPPTPQPVRGDLDAPTPQEVIFAAELGRLGVRYDYASKAYLIPDASRDPPTRRVMPDSLFDRLIIRGYLDLGADRELSHELLYRYLRLWREDQEAKVVETVRERLRAVDRDKGQQELKRWLDIICREGADLSQVIMTQWIWLVRCKLFCPDRADSHVMPVLQGKQGGRKSKAVRALLAPIQPLATSWNFEQLCDDRNWLELPRRYVGYIEEMAKAHKDQLSTLKGLITAKTRDVRVFRTQDRTEVLQNCSFIGDTNEHVPDIIHDRTGGRRFWEIRCKDDIPEEPLYSIDYHAIWCCVSEQDPCPTQNSEHFETIKELQSSKMRHQEPVDNWIREYNIEPGPVWVEAKKKVYSHFSNYCREYRDFSKNPSYTSWKKSMQMRGFTWSTQRVNGKPSKVIGLFKTL